MKIRRENKTAVRAGADYRFLQWFYPSILFLMALTGFGQMPIYKRYYISDIPGLNWLADFWTTRYIHYVGAVVLLALLAYAAIEFLSGIRRERKLTPTGKLRLGLLGAIVLTGVVFVVKNFKIYLFSPDFIVFLSLCHLGCVMLFLMANLYCLVFKKQWTTLR